MAESGSVPFLLAACSPSVNLSPSPSPETSGFWNHPPSWEHERRGAPGCFQVLFPRRSEERYGLPRPRSRGITVASRESEAQDGGSACAGASRKHSSLRRAGPAVRGAGGTRALPRSLVRAAREAVGTQCAFGIVGRGDRAGKVPGWRSSPRRVWLGRPSTPRRAQALFSGVLEGEPPRGQGAELGLLAGPYTAFLRGPVEQSLQELNRATHGFSRLRVFDAVCLRGRARSGLSG